jgi:LacI family transcriptional regulator
MSSQPTIKDVARMSGVSIGTVDRVLHHRGKVSAQNEQAVLRAIEALNYRPSQIARALVSRKNNLKIGVCLPQVESEFWTEALSGVEYARSKLLPFGVELILEYTYNYGYLDQREAVLRLLSKGASSIVLVPGQGPQSHLDEIIPPEIPYATVIEDVPTSRRLFHVGPDDPAMGLLAGRLATLYAGQGFRGVILAANQQFLGTQQRIEGFRSLLAKHNPSAVILETCDIPMESEKIAYQNIYETAVNQLLRHPDMNVFYVTNGLTQWAAAAVKSSKRQGKVQVFGYECTEMTHDFIHEGIIGATIYQRPAQQWYNALMLMYEYLIGDRIFEETIFRAECSIMIEESLPFVHRGGISTL